MLLGIGSVLPFIGLTGVTVQGLLLAAVICFLLGWFALGIQAIRLDRPATATRAA